MSGHQQLSLIHQLFLQTLLGRYQLQPVSLRHPFPEHPIRALGILRIDGVVYSSERFLRVMVLTTRFLFSSRCTRSIFLSPRPDLYLPCFSSETILMGSKRAFLVDIHTTVRKERWQELCIEEKIFEIKSRYSALWSRPLTLQGRINEIMSKGCVYVQVPPESDNQALGIFNEYLSLYLDLVDTAQPSTMLNACAAAEDARWYYDLIIHHDPAVKLYIMLFGKKGGIDRVNDLFFAC